MSAYHKKEQGKVRVIKHLAQAITAVTNNSLPDALFHIALATIRLVDIDDGESAEKLLTEVKRAQAELGEG